jgi:putative flippase GtrA
MASHAAGSHSRVRALLPEISKFCLIGGIGTVIDLGGAALLHGKFQVEPLVAKAVAVTASTLFTYLGSRFWTFRHREKQPLRREAVLFFGLNIVGLLIAEAVIAIVTYVLGRHSALSYNVASFIGSGLGTVFRFYSYHKWVFAEPARPAVAVEPARPDHPRWELDHAYLAAEVEAKMKAPTYPSPGLPSGRHRKAS